MSTEPPLIHRGSNSGYQAVNLALHLWVKRIVLLGFDMNNSHTGASHWHGGHEGRLANPTEHNFYQWRRAFGEAVADIERAGVDIVNASRYTSLECFRKVSLEDVLC